MGEYSAGFKGDSIGEGLVEKAGAWFLGLSEQITYPPTHGERLALADRYAVLPAGSHRAARQAGILFLCRCLSAWLNHKLAVGS
jgi:hypothetical protein